MTVLRDYAAAVHQPTGEPAAPYDEVVDPSGALRPAWKEVAAEALELTETDLARAHRDIRRFLVDDGVTYRRPGEVSHRWHLDPLPLLIDAEQWRVLESGLVQRAELLDALLADLYGPQHMLARGVLPPEVIYAHEGFLRALVRPHVGDAPRTLHVAATDVGRTAAGEWVVIGDRTQAPSGIGYAMENRHVISRVLPDLYRGAELHQIGPFVQALRASLVAAAPPGASDPRVVVLTPGTASETSYDQAHLASALGFPLVRGSDLVVRGGAVWMRVYGRLERVDVIVRRVDATWSDPLELRGDSHLGVAGLVEAVRRGEVAVVNGLGSGVLENPGLLPFMTRLCEALLDEPLRLATVPTQWLGDPEALASARAREAEVLVRPIDRSAPGLPDDPAQRWAVVEAAPYRYVAQELPAWSQAPSLASAAPALAERPTAVVARPVAMRTFTIRHGAGFRPLLGALGSIMDGARAVSSKDVWVLKEEPDQPDQGGLADVQTPDAATVPPLVPRALDHLFWFGRYAIRAEDTTRLVLATHTLAENDRWRPRSPGGQALGVLRHTLATLSPGGFDLAATSDIDPDHRSLLLDEHRLCSVAQSIAGLRHAADEVRDQLSADVWRAFGVADRAAEQLRESRHGLQITDSAEQLLSSLLAVHGATASMVQDDGWQALDAGRALERALQICHLLRPTLTRRRSHQVDRVLAEAVLTAAESVVTHRRRHRGSYRAAGLLELLLEDTTNPRSLRHSLVVLRDRVGALPLSTGSTRPERLLDDLLEETGRLGAEVLASADGGVRADLERHLATTTGHLMRFAEAFEELHLDLAPPQRALGLVGRSVGP